MTTTEGGRSWVERVRPPLARRIAQLRARVLALPLRRLLTGALAPLLVLVVNAGLAMLLFEGVWKSPTSVTLEGGDRDAAIFLWSLRWVAHVTFHGGNLLVSHQLNYPDGVNLMWNTTLLLPGWLLSPVTSRWGEVLSFNLILVLAFTLSGWCAYLAIRRYARNHPAAALGGLIYAFSPAMRTQAYHPHISLAFLPPLMLLALDEILVRQRRHPLPLGALLGLMAGAQLWTGEEVLAGTALFGTLLLVLLVALHPRKLLEPRRVLHALASFATALVVFAAIAAWPLTVQFTGPQRVSGDVQTRDYADDLHGFVLPGGEQWLTWPAARHQVRSFPVGNAAYLGVPLIVAVLVAAVVLFRRPVVRVGLLLALGAASLSLGPVLHVGNRVAGVGLPWGLLQRLPLLSSLIPSRLAMFTAGFAGLLVAVLLAEAWRGGGWQRWLAVGAAPLVVLPLLPSGAAPVAQVRTPSFFTTAAVRQVPRGSTLLVLPYPDREVALAMTWQARSDLWFRQPGGYFIGPTPDGSPRFDANPTPLAITLGKIFNGGPPPTSLNASQREAFAADLRRWHVGTVVVGPMPHRDDMVWLLTRLFRRQPQEVGGVQLWRHPVVDPHPGKL